MRPGRPWGLWEGLWEAQAGVDKTLSVQARGEEGRPGLCSQEQERPFHAAKDCSCPLRGHLLHPDADLLPPCFSPNRGASGV